MGFSLDRLIGENLDVNGRRLSVTKKLGEGGFAFVYLTKVKASSRYRSSNNNNNNNNNNNHANRSSSRGRRRHQNLPLSRRVLRSLSRTRRRRASSYIDEDDDDEHLDEEEEESCYEHSHSYAYDYKNTASTKVQSSEDYLVLKTASTATPERRTQSENELHYLRLLGGHPNIVNLIDCSFQTMNQSSVCLMLLTHCEGGSLMDVVRQVSDDATSSLLTAFKVVEYFSQLSEAVYHLHTLHDDEDETVATLGGESVNITVASDVLNGKAILSSSSEKIHARSSPYKASSIFRRVGQHYRKPIVHRDLKLENVLLKQDDSMPTGYRCQLCDFGSAIEGRVDLRNAEDRRKHGEIIRSSTTQMYRAPEMVDLHLVPELTERTDIWSLGCCLYTLCFLRNCFEENSNLAILTGEYTIPSSHPFPRELIELLSRMLCMDPNQRASIDEVLECLDAIKNREALPPRVSKRGRGIQGVMQNASRHHQQKYAVINEKEKRREPSPPKFEIKRLHQIAENSERYNVSIYDKSFVFTFSI